MRTVGIVGANGQVGLEVSLFLSLMDDVRVIPICRSRLASAVLRRCGLACRHGSVVSAGEAPGLLAECDVVVDCSLPTGLASEVRRAARAIVGNCLRFSERSARFVYVSSIMAFGMSATSRSVRHHLVAWTKYGTAKREGERVAFGQGRRLGKAVYALRAGQVHGEIQGVGRSVRRMLAAADDGRLCVPFPVDAPSNTVFAFTVAEAIHSIALDGEEPGLYTLVSTPQWTWRELFEWYARRSGVTVLVGGSGRAAGEVKSGLHGKLGAVVRTLLRQAARFASDHRELASALLLARLPALELRLMALYFSRKVEAEVSATTAMPAGPLIVFGDAPGRRLNGVSDSKETMEDLAQAVRTLVAKAGFAI